MFAINRFLRHRVSTTPTRYRWQLLAKCALRSQFCVLKFKDDSLVGHPRTVDPIARYKLQWNWPLFSHIEAYPLPLPLADHVYKYLVCTSTKLFIWYFLMPGYSDDLMQTWVDEGFEVTFTFICRTEDLDYFQCDPACLAPEIQSD